MAFLLLFAVSTHVGAQEISVEAARQTAAKFINEHAAKLPAKNRKGMMKAPPKAESLQLVYTQEDQLHESPALYVFEQPKQGGFVIASADERAYPILGYNEIGTFREDSLPCCLKFILEEYGKQIAEARKQNLPRHTEKTENESWQNIEPLLTCAWHQRAPFNNLCPIDKYTGERCATGCVATAMAQIMYYWKWPERGVGSYSYQTDNVEGTLTANFEETTYRWDLMKDEYKNGYDDPENAVATLMYHCGVALNMDYSSSGSGAGSIISPLKRYFNYSDAISFIRSDFENTIYKELLHKRPVEMSGSSNNDNHAYICDGYRTDGFFHFNLGWGGSANSYYKLNAVAGYSSWSATINIAPKGEDIVDHYGNIYEQLGDEASLMKGGDVKGHLEIPAQVTSSNGTKLPVTKIFNSSFENNTSITSVTIPNFVTSIGVGAFEGCTSLTSVSIPNSVTTIGQSAFCKCSGLTSVTISNSVTSIGHFAFLGCSGLQKVIVKDIAAWCGIDFGSASNPLEYAQHLYSDENTEITDLVIPDGVTSINNGAFLNCSGLTSITIPNSVTNIGYDAFSGCRGLTSVTIGDSVTSIGERVFSGCEGLTSISVAFGNNKYDSRDNCNAIIETASNTLIIGCKKTIIPNSVTKIGGYAFYVCTGLTSVTIPNSVTSIGEGAFSYCYGLTSINIPNSVTSIGNNAFSYCQGLTSVTIPNSLTSIGREVFFNCRGLTSVTIPNSVTSIGAKAFEGCYGLRSVTIPNSVTSIGFGAFQRTGIYNNSADGVFYVDKWVCGYKGTMPANTNLILQEGTLGIADSAFGYCSGLTSITIPNSVTSIGIYAFENCSGLTSITIPNSVTNIGYAAFSGCQGLTSVTIGDSVTSIGEKAFSGCEGLTSITIPNSVTSIGTRAFFGCSGMTSVTSCIENPFVIDPWVFFISNYTRSNATLYVPIGTSDKYKSTDGWKYFKNIVEIEIDGIEGVTVGDSNSSNSENAPMYNLSGQRVGKNYKGIVIKNGKKMIVK